MGKIKKDHVKDIDWRKREARQENAIQEIEDWYDESIRREDYRQARAFSAVLWLLMTKSDYKKWQQKNTIAEEQEATALLDEEALEQIKQFI